MKFANLINLIILGSLALGCGDDNNPLTTASDLTGTWEALSVEFTTDQFKHRRRNKSREARQRP